MRLPTSNKVTVPYGATGNDYLGDDRVHYGTDYSARWNPAVYLPEKCKITRVGDAGDCGLSIDAQSIDGQRGYRFCHLKETFVTTPHVHAEGKKIGTMGMSGLAYGTHLHFVMWLGDKIIDGDKYIKENQMTKPTAQEVDTAFIVANRGKATEAQQSYYTQRDVNTLRVDLRGSVRNTAKRAWNAALASASKAINKLRRT